MTSESTNYIRSEIPVANLLLDQTNPRLESEQPSQVECLEAVVQNQGEKVINLASHIADVGLDPSILFIVTPWTDDPKRFVVLDANRRLAALRLLAKPSTVVGLGKKFENTLRTASQRYAKAPIKQVLCTIFPTREAATQWILLRHGGEQGGRGQVNWDAVESTRFQERLDGKARASAAVDVINLVRTRGQLDDDTISRLRDIPITTVQRVLNDPAVRERVGIAIKDGRLALTTPEAEALKGLTRIIRDAAHKKLPVSRVDTKEDRKHYLDSFNKNELPAAGTPRGAAKDVEPTEKPKSQSAGTNAPKRKQSTKDRQTIIPKAYKIDIVDTKSNNIFSELKQLKVEDFANAAGALLRVFLELSVDRFLADKMQVKTTEIDQMKLKGKIDTIARRLKDNQIMDKRDLHAVNRMTDPNHFLTSSVDTLHQYVHSRSFAPSPRDLKDAWDSLEPFFTQLWV